MIHSLLSEGPLVSWFICPKVHYENWRVCRKHARAHTGTMDREKYKKLAQTHTTDLNRPTTRWGIFALLASLGFHCGFRCGQTLGLCKFFLHFSQSLVPVFIPLFIHLQITSTFVFLHNSYINISEKTLMLRTEK